MISHALSTLRGRLVPQVPLASRTWFRVGGVAEWLYQPADHHDLALALHRLPDNVPITVLGACSNVIIRDGGIDGVVIRLAQGFSEICVETDGLVAGGASLDTTIAKKAAQAGLAGLEFLSGIPGSLGGAVRMNAGAYHSDIATVLEWADIITRSGEIIRLDNTALRFGYRCSGLSQDSIVIRARLRGIPDTISDITNRTNQIHIARKKSQPIHTRTGGSTFRNPDHALTPLKAWELIDAAGCRGLRHGDAQMSEKHCNFMINLGHATATDLETLGEDVRNRVFQNCGIDLHWEIKRLGKHPQK
ncbi:MAG: UDP-N-acetylmuramate dehydrogenase [Acetobacter sp.]|nr:UDP-N-acetylmuramate dehydrogenase [Acetobacter sp.]MBO6035536.1 UDP-N-acetylmuramate dehydrogenase [Acetobacter sp.]MBO6091710.1 UDP-N-acetylmuramate dehydrogenase [Acetobacter sp.]MBO7351022.1 UDP-N-acetylmuramate dehydrogenase [Acetobacter sp.]MBQ3818448.1 UDP-N-acetylmuramate dehydrogenase [Acetobacter sp.]